MPKDFSSGFLTSLAADNLEMFQLIAIYFDNRTVRITTLPGGMNINFQGEEWEALDQFISIGTIGESADITTEGWAVTLSGLTNEYLTNATDYYYQGRRVEYYVGLIETNGTITVEPTLLQASVIDNQTVSVGESTFSVTVNCMPAINKILESREERYTDEDQQSKYPGDTGLSRMATMPNKQYSWGSFVTSQHYVSNRYA